MNIALVLGAALAVLCVVLVALPFLREPEPVSDELDELTPERRRRLALAEERDRALAALKELEADHRAGRVNDEDYRASIGPLRREAAEALRALDRPAPVDEAQGERLKPRPARSSPRQAASVAAAGSASAGMIRTSGSARQRSSSPRP